LPAVKAPLFDYYVVLGVERQAGVAELRRAYRLLALRFHPDRAGVQSTEVFQRIAEAYRVLSDATARAAYDQRLHAAESTRFGRRSTGAAARGPGNATEGDVYGPGGKITWRHGAREASRVDDLIDRLCGPLEALVARAAARRLEDGALELRLLADEARQGGTAAIDTSVEILCPTCLGGAHPGRLWCARCEHAGRVLENLTICIPIPPAVADGVAFSVATDGEGRGPPLRVRIRVG
jgi:molecular chaperone DnaJ